MPASKKAPAKSAAADAFTLLKHDHDEVKNLFKDYEKLVKDEADDDEKATLAERICTMLTVHAAIEEEIFYPAARDVLEEQDVLDEAEVEHASAKELIAQIEDMEPDEPLYDAKVTVLGEYVNHHVKEEEDEMFPKLKKTDFDKKGIGESLAQRKEELMSEMGYEDEDEDEA